MSQNENIQHGSIMTKHSCYLWVNRMEVSWMTISPGSEHTNWDVVNWAKLNDWLTILLGNTNLTNWMMRIFKHFYLVLSVGGKKLPIVTRWYSVREKKVNIVKFTFVTICTYIQSSIGVIKNSSRTKIYIFTHLHMRSRPSGLFLSFHI